MQKVAYGFVVETHEDTIRIQQEDYCIVISPDEVETLVDWLKQAQRELRGHQTNSQSG